MKKVWIKIKRGLSEDPKHREAMGMAVWLFMHMCDAADFEKGMVYDWTDKGIGIDMTLSTNTVRQWRASLVEHGYISCRQKQHSIEITIYNWIDPRDYSGKVINPHVQGESVVSPSKKKKSKQGESQVVVQGESQGLNSANINPTPFIQSESESESLTTTTGPNIFRLYESNIGPLVPLIADGLKDLEKDYSAEWVSRAIVEAATNNVRKLSYIRGVLVGYKERGSPDIPRDKTKFKTGGQNAKQLKADAGESSKSDSALADSIARQRLGLHV